MIRKRPSRMRINRHALRVIRERSGLSVSELARRSGVTQPHLSNIEGGRRGVSPAVVLALAEALSVPVLALIAEGGHARDPSVSDDTPEQ